MPLAPGCKNSINLVTTKDLVEPFFYADIKPLLMETKYYTLELAGIRFQHASGSGSPFDRRAGKNGFSVVGVESGSLSKSIPRKKECSLKL